MLFNFSYIFLKKTEKTLLKKVKMPSIYINISEKYHRILVDILTLKTRISTKKI